MSKMKTAWALSQLEKFIALADQRTQGSVAAMEGGDLFKSLPETSRLKDEFDAQGHVVEKILDRVVPSWRPAKQGFTYNSVLREWAVRVKTQLEREEELRVNLGDDAPEMDAGLLHSWAWKNTISYWRTGHYRQAVIEASKLINAETQAKLSRRDVSEADLFTQAFSLDQPKSGKPRLRLMDDDGSDTYKNLHTGAAAFARGLYSAIRNPGSHEVNNDEMDPHLALEQLAAFSILARWVDEAQVETDAAT